MDPGDHYLQITIAKYVEYKEKAEKAFNQIKDTEKLFWLADDESNSIALLIKHISGNMRSRWTNFLTSDGEKPDRNRPSEFDQEWSENKEDLMRRWEAGWETTLNALNSLTADDLMKTVTIRQKPHTVLEAMQRQLTHYAEHVGQILFLAKQITTNWKSLSIPRDK